MLNQKAKIILKMEYAALKLKARNEILNKDLNFEAKNLEMVKEDLQKREIAMKLLEDKEKWIAAETKKLHQKNKEFLALIDHV